MLQRKTTRVAGRHGMGTILALILAGLAAACEVPVTTAETLGTDDTDTRTLVVYSGRNENLVGPLLDRFAADTGINVKVRYGNTAAMAATILEEGTHSPADIYYGQDAGALGALAKMDRFRTLPADVQATVDPAFVGQGGLWVGTSLRARVLVYNTDMLGAEDLPDDIWALTADSWRDQVGWAPPNGSFQAFVTALRVMEGEDRAQAWLEAMIANDVQNYPKNTPIVAAVGAGEIQVGLVNHYYLLRFKATEPDFPAANFHFRNGGPGSMVNVAGVGIVDSCANCREAEEFVRYLLSEAAQTYFLETTHEYPVLRGDFAYSAAAVPLEEINMPDLNLDDLDDLEGTLTLLRAVGALE